jgi:hypothetical protein
MKSWQKGLMLGIALNITWVVYIFVQQSLSYDGTCLYLLSNGPKDCTYWQHLHEFFGFWDLIDIMYTDMWFIPFGVILLSVAGWVLSAKYIFHKNEE